MQQEVRSHGGRAAAGRALMSFFRLRLKQQYRILRWPVFRPSTMHGMERSRSLREYRISSCRAANVHRQATGSSGIPYLNLPLSPRLKNKRVRVRVTP